MYPSCIGDGARNVSYELNERREKRSKEREGTNEAIAHDNWTAASNFLPGTPRVVSPFVHYERARERSGALCVSSAIKNQREERKNWKNKIVSLARRRSFDYAARARARRKVAGACIRRARHYGSMVDMMFVTLCCARAQARESLQLMYYGVRLEYLCADVTRDFFSPSRDVAENALFLSPVLCSMRNLKKCSQLNYIL